METSSNISMWSRFRALKTWQQISIALIVLIVLRMLLDPGSSAPTNESLSPTPSNSQEAENSPSPTQTWTPLEQLEIDLKETLGGLNRDGQRIISIDLYDGQLFIQYALNDNLSTNLIKVGAWKDTRLILETVQASKIKGVKELVASGTFPLQNEYGESLGEIGIFTITFDAQAIKRTVTENLPGELLESAATDVTIRRDILD
jgi:hypothetical protein